ncbi:hypothetical protein AX14_012935 [Amanita brunnescens Koide BX004]|nr:hypothetical protein AX14_012935 [Amanita brunnescens Koide BX004]
MAKRPRKGPFNSVLDPSEYKSGSSAVGLSHAVRVSGRYDPWHPEEEEVLPEELQVVQKTKVKAPKLPHPRQIIDAPAVAEPHQGTSYNPSFEAYQELLLQAHEKEGKRVREAEKFSDIKEKISKLELADEDETVAPGMKLDVVTTELEERVDGEAYIVSPKKVSERKTKLQRQKAARHLAEQRALAAKVTRRRLLASVAGAKALRHTMLKSMKAREEERAHRRLALKDRTRRRGLAGRKLGKHKVPEGDVEVQLGEDLSESFRSIKPEGNLFRDRFLSMQQRALIEPRVRIIPKKRRAKVVEYEKHAWKRFE